MVKPRDMSSTGSSTALDACCLLAGVAGDASLWRRDEVAAAANDDDDDECVCVQLRGSELSRRVACFIDNDRRLSDAFLMWDSERDYKEHHHHHRHNYVAIAITITTVKSGNIRDVINTVALHWA